MLLQELPPEITQKIFEYLDRRDLRELLYICKKWHYSLKIMYFKNVDVYREKIQWIKKHFSPTLKDEANTFKPLSMTTQLRITNDFKYKNNLGDLSHELRLTKEELLLLLLLFPNLKCLDIKESSHRLHYMKVLDTCEPERMPPLEEIIMGFNYNERHFEDLCRLNFAVSYKLRHSLRHITVWNINGLTEEKSFMETLVDFKSLKTLIVFNHSDLNITILRLLQACPNLSCLEYTSNLSNREDRAQHKPHTLKGRPVLPHAKYLKKLKLAIPRMTTLYKDFFEYHSLESLEDVEIYTSKLGLYNWISAAGTNIIQNFCKSLQKFKSVRLTFADEGLVDSKKIDLFYEVLNAFRGQREFRHHSIVHRARTMYDGKGVDIRITGSKIQYTYCFKIEDHQNSNITAPSDLNQLAKVDTFKVLVDYEDMHGIPTKYLDHVKRYCPSLTEFYIDCDSWDYFFKAECLDRTKPSVENMTHMVVDGPEVTQEVLDSLFCYFPKIEVLNLGVYDGSKKEKISFNLSKFQHLHTFIIDLRGHSRLPAGPFVLEYMDGKRLLNYFLYLEWFGQGRNSFDRISDDMMQEELEGAGKDDTYVFHVKGPPQLAKLELRKNRVAYASTDFTEE